MKTIIATLLLLPTFVWSQNQINYEIERDAPDEIPWISMNLDLFSLDIPVNNFNSTSFYLGLWGYVKPIEKLPLSIDYSLKRSYLVVGALGDKEYPKSWMAGLGGRFNLIDRTKTKKANVVLKSEKVYFEGNEGTKTTSVSVLASRRRVTAVRGGLYLRRRGFNSDEIEALDFTSKMNTTGVYGGIMLTTFRNVFIKTDQYGTSGNSKGIDVYADAIFAGNKFTRVSDGSDVTDFTKTRLDKRTPVGLRVGFQTYEIEEKLYTDKMLGINYNLEFGILPYEGLYVQGGITMTLLKLKK